MKMQQQAFTYLISLLQNQHQRKLPSIYIVIESYAEVVFDVCADNEVYRKYEICYEEKQSTDCTKMVNLVSIVVFDFCADNKVYHKCVQRY